MKTIAKKIVVGGLSVLLCLMLCACSGGAETFIDDPDHGAAPDGGAQGPQGGVSGEDSSFPWESDGQPNYGYDAVVEQGFYDTAEAPSSYFSLDRNTANYAYVRAQIMREDKVAPDSVRLEELVNYFSYDYPAPEAGEGIAVTPYLADCPWNAEHKLLTLGIRTETAQRTGSGNYVLLVDVSGSMGGVVSGTEGQTRLDLVKLGANKLVDSLGADDRLSIVTYANGVETVLASTAATEENKPVIRNAIAKLTSYGSTYGSGGLERAYAEAEKYAAEAGNSRVVLLSDGDFNVGVTDRDELTEFIQSKAQGGVALSVIGVGLGNTRDDILQTLALNGNGNYAYMDSPLEAEKIFTEELAGTLYTVANDAKAGVTFNADTVSSYRLLGYDLKMISEDDFNNPEKDTGEIGSNLCVTVMYELALTGEEGDLAEAAVRFRDTADADREIACTVTREECETADTQFAACVAEFALVLRESQYMGTASLSGVLSRLAALPEGYLAGDAYKESFFDLVQKAEQSGFYGAAAEPAPDAAE